MTAGSASAGTVGAPFAVLVLVLFAFALDPDRGVLVRASAGLFWLAVAFCALLVTRRGLGSLAEAWTAPKWLWLGAVLGTFVVFTITLASPRIGTAATIGLLVAGQLAAGAVIDRYGLFGFEKIALNWPRALGIALLAAGAALTLKR